MSCPCSIPRWVRGSLLGAGSFGTVNLALNVGTGELFAVKSIDFSHSSGASTIAMENELRLLQSLDSPFVIRCFGGDETCENGVQMRNLFMEYMAGGSLADLMRKFGGALDEALIRVYARGIVEGLEYLHGQGVVHCDIKGKNILIGGTGVKVADLGSAKRIGQQEHAMRGTPLWMAPEVIMQEEQGFPSDIWSLGCTVVEMATGRPPWSHAQLTPLAALMQIGAAQQALPPLPDCLSPEAKDFLSKCLHRNPKERWTASQLLKHPFLQKKNVNQGLSSVCRHHAEEAAAPLSPTSVLDVGAVGGDSTSSWESNRRSVPLLHCPEVGRFGRGMASVTAAEGGRIEEGNCTPPVTPDEEGRGGWITVRSPRPRGEERQRPLSNFMLGVAEAAPEAGGCGGGANFSLQFLRSARRPPTLPAATSCPRRPAISPRRPMSLPYRGTDRLDHSSSTTLQ
ncbi:hypothetical protein GOP47_0020624 [Adiantum capillus-veneris]|uniref:Protein kinase domain-containing protein n=1 Tax=Adiantum capillus-veneris TaxID=13818 RepID=A0A9D4Z754_ADICA|nr:hypothetical protein GOP47_0020624 [Adiantum capillus-veneris]